MAKFKEIPEIDFGRAPKYEYLQVSDFSGGINISASPDLITQNQLLDAKNVDLDTIGGFKTRKGYVVEQDVGTEERINRIYELRRTDKSIERLVSYGTYLTKWDGTVIADDLDSTDFSIEIYHGKAYFVNGHEYYVYDGETFEPVTPKDDEENDLEGVRRCTSIVQRGQRFFAAGDPEYPNRLYFSEIGEPNFFKFDSFIHAVSDDGDHITGLYAEYHGALLAFKERRIYAWFGSDPYSDVQFTAINVSSGAPSVRTVCAVDNYLFYAGYDGVYALVGLDPYHISSFPISSNISPAYKTLKDKDQMTAVYYDNKYMISARTTDSDYNDVIWVYHKPVTTYEQDTGLSESWTYYKGWNIRDFMIGWDGYLYGAGNDAKIYKLFETLNDAGETIEAYVETSPYSMGYPGYVKQFRRAVISGRQYKDVKSFIDVTAKIDYGRLRFSDTEFSEAYAWGFGTWNGGVWGFNDLVNREFLLGTKGHRLVFKFHCDELDSIMEIYSIGVQFRFTKPQGREVRRDA